MSSATRIGWTPAHNAELADADPLYLHREIKIEQNRVIRDLETFHMKMVFGKSDRVAPKIVGKSHLLQGFVQHLLKRVGVQAGQPCLDFAAIAQRREIEQ